MCAKDAATLLPLRGTMKGRSLAFMKRRTTERINESWISDTNRRMEKGGRRRGAFRGAGWEGETEDPGSLEEGTEGCRGQILSVTKRPRNDSPFP